MNIFKLVHGRGSTANNISDAYEVNTMHALARQTRLAAALRKLGFTERDLDDENTVVSVISNIERSGVDLGYGGKSDSPLLLFDIKLLKWLGLDYFLFDAVKKPPFNERETRIIEAVTNNPTAVVKVTCNAFDDGDRA